MFLKEMFIFGSRKHKNLKILFATEDTEDTEDTENTEDNRTMLSGVWAEYRQPLHRKGAKET